MEFTNSESEDKIAWLRQRGVQIEIPESRQQRSKNLGDPSMERVITVVKIPWDTSLPYENVEVKIDDSAPGDQLKEMLKCNFVGGNVDYNALESAASGLLMQASGTCASSVQKETIMNMISNQGHVENFPLTRPHASNGYAGVSLYLDEAGQLKQLPHNARAAALAACCGFESVQLVGDIYVGRVCVMASGGTTSGLSHESFTTAEMSSEAEWIRNATRENFQHGIETNRVAMQGGDATVTASSEQRSTDANGRAFTWTQSEEGVDISVHLNSAESISGGSSSSSANWYRLVDVDISSSKVSVKVPVDGGSEKAVLLDVKLHAPIRSSESTWSVSGDVLEIYLEKQVEGNMWSHLEK